MVGDLEQHQGTHVERAESRRATLPHMTAHDVGEIDRGIRDALTELGEG
jgi:hypothetical protein